MATTRAINLKTEIPGPRSREILDRKARVIAEPLSIYLPIVIEEAQGATITDVDGNTFIDFTGGVGCLNVGHSHPDVVAAAVHRRSSAFAGSWSAPTCHRRPSAPSTGLPTWRRATRRS